MNRDDLLLLKKSFDNKKKYTQYLPEEGPLYNELTEAEILQSMSSSQAVDGVMEMLKLMVVSLSSQDVSYNGIGLVPTFSVFVDNDYISEDGYITSSKAILKDYVGISFARGYVYSGRSHAKVFPVGDFEESANIFYTSFNDFVIGLNECGLELDGITSFADIKKLVSEDKTPNGTIRVSFSKNKTYQKNID